ncbi:hypothetical protein VCRA2122O339_240006 [Vibrio crassostreae]|nr:hypothetical protein VCRA2120E331_250087 [Vibrio crassostreae]CAK3358239.1 hypothetical protein VCRA2127O345_250006 [Vibrio crassostreae]CAK3373345.1 hypothetical protein VCRA2120E330_240086 [Vibrio crassostreae]CAK3377211.1 hypothetical protein VCRA2122O339_240006 [Vibrio crassostreae]CAK3404345.1 hypothetical protein VCRA2122O338_250086 [Vibrio crassostreae]
MLGLIGITGTTGVTGLVGATVSGRFGSIGLLGVDEPPPQPVKIAIIIKDKVSVFIAGPQLIY